jgi:hypothetical protein
MRSKVNRGGSVLLAVGLVVAGAACGGGGGSASDFCDVVEDAQADFAEFEEFDGSDTSNLEETFTQAGEAFEELADSAPSEIEDDMKVLNEAMQDFLQVLEDADWDVFALAADEDAAAKLEALSSEDFETASDNVAQFAKDECGVDLEGGSGDSGDSGDDSEEPSDDTAAADEPSDDTAASDVPVDDDLVDQLASVYEETFGLSSDKATCLAEAILGGGGDLEDASDPSAFMDLLDDCDISIDELGG